MIKLKSYSPKQAWEQLKSNTRAILVDVRSGAENRFVGRVPNSIFIPWLEMPNWQVDEGQFIATFERLQIDKNSEIILICRSGHRSKDAGNCLMAQGFTNVGHVTTGFEGDLDENRQRGNINGWRYDDMPWEQS